MFGMGKISEEDQQYIAHKAPHGMAFHNSAPEPLSVAGISFEEIEQKFEPVEYYAGDFIGMTQTKFDKTDYGARRPMCFHTSKFSYAPSGRAKCYVTGNTIAKGALRRISFGILSHLVSTDAIATHGYAEGVLKVLGESVGSTSGTD